MDTITQKSIARTLDACAARADMANRSPATSRQCWFLAHLILTGGNAEAEHDDFMLDTQRILTKRDASELIDFYLELKNAA